MEYALMEQPGSPTSSVNSDRTERRRVSFCDQISIIPEGTDMGEVLEAKSCSASLSSGEEIRLGSSSCCQGGYPLGQAHCVDAPLAPTGDEGPQVSTVRRFTHRRTRTVSF
mmetsp:Transcript_6365/g.18735  ORF Transcript_6365/g.18735 Transcript_6365/m.18735 type:complete len:111 (+) Transcript_6365:66-398(+)